MTLAAQCAEEIEGRVSRESGNQCTIERQACLTAFKATLLYLTLWIVSCNDQSHANFLAFPGKPYCIVSYYLYIC